MNAKHTKHKQDIDWSSIEWARERQITDHFGLTHTILYNLRKQGEIRTVSLRGKGKQYGARLFHVESIRHYLAKQEAAEVQP